MAGNVFVGIDAGTNGVTVAFFGSDGHKLSSVDVDYPCHYPHPGWVEQDMEEVWRAICRASRSARADAGVSDREIGSLGFSSQRGTFVLLDDRERILAPAIVWNDSRAKEMEQPIAEAVGRARYRQITGVPLSASWSAAKLLWLRRHRPELMERARWILNGQEFFLRRLGAESFETDPASLTLNGMMDIRRLDWSDEVCRAAGVERGLLPPVGPPGRQVGRLSDRAAEQTGLPAGLAICRGAGDQQCAAVGSGVVRQGLAEITIGTSAMMVAHLDHPDLLEGPAPYIGGHGVAGKWDLEGGAFAIGSCLEWWKRELGHKEVAEAERAGGDAWGRMMALAATAPAGARGAIFHPFFCGQVTPYYDVTARGAFLGLGLHHDRASLLRALLEGCACEIRLMVDAFERDLRGGLTSLRVTGGGTRSALFTQIQADVIGRPIGIPAEPECTVLGAALLGAVGAGAFAGVDEAVDAMVRIARQVDPDPALRSLYEDLHGLFTEAYERAAESGVSSRIYDFQASNF